MDLQGVSLSTFVKFYKWRNAVLSRIRPVLYRKEQKYRCRNKYWDAPVRDWDARRWNADAGGIILDAGAKLWVLPMSV